MRCIVRNGKFVWGVTLSRRAAVEEARSIMRDSVKPEPSIECNRHATIRHEGSHFTLWSDGVVTNPIYERRRWKGLVKRPRRKTLPSSVASLIDANRGSDTPASSRDVSKIAAMRSARRVAAITLAPGRGHYAPLSAERWTLRDQRGGEHSLYAMTQGYAEGFMFELFWTRGELDRAILDYSNHSLSPEEKAELGRVAGASRRRLRRRRGGRA